MLALLAMQLTQRDWLRDEAFMTFSKFPKKTKTQSNPRQQQTGACHANAGRSRLCRDTTSRRKD